MMNELPGMTVSYVSLLDDVGNTLKTVPLNYPATIPKGEEIDSVEVTIKLDVTMTLKRSAR